MKPDRRAGGPPIFHILIDTRCATAELGPGLIEPAVVFEIVNPNFKAIAGNCCTTG